MDSPTASDGSPFGDIPTRPMRVKVLYSFDNENKTNCLARFPDTLHIPAVAIDENSQVGVIELRQCIQAIVSASPELLSCLTGGDFTIYAYDYSEYETPLVGQGMLSAALAAAAPITPAHQSKTMITGRVCKNLPALFSNGVKETLEVKLRLVPVPKQVQNEYVRSMESLRSMSPATSAGFDPNAWTASFSHPASQQTAGDMFSFDGQQSSNADQSLLDEIFGLGEGSGGASGRESVGIAQTPSDGLVGANPAFAAHPHSAPGSRAGSPMMGLNSSSLNEQLRHQSFSGNPSNFADHSRPGSRASVQSESYQPNHQQQHQALTQPTDLQQQTEIYYNEDGQPRKRARVTQADWRGKSSFGSKSSDLRVTAATAASMQLHRPVPTRPSAPGSNLEPPPRVPTPVPHVNALPHQRSQQSTGPRSLLRQASTAAGSDFMSDIDQMSEAIMSSPEENSPDNSITAEGTPQEFPSSPPLFPGINMPQPSSPGLPALPMSRMADSGYMSERNVNSSAFMDHFDMDNGDGNPDGMDYEAAVGRKASKRPKQTRIKSEGLSTAAMPPPYPSDAPTSEINFSWEQPGDMNQLPNKMLLNLPPHRARESSQGPRPTAVHDASRTHSPAPRSATPAQVLQAESQPRAQQAPVAMQMHGQSQEQARGRTPTDSEPPQSRRGSLALPAKRPMPAGSEADAPVRPAKKRQTSYRPRSTYEDSEAGSPAPSDTEGRPAGPKRSGSGAVRRKQIEDRMHAAVAKGQMPQYCAHCGSIDTPTWRRLFFKVIEGKPGPLDYVEGESETVGLEELERDDNGEVTKFVVRKTIKRSNAREAPSAGVGFQEITVCNPCGLWFNKSRTMRPRDKWHKKSGTRKSSKRPKAGDAGPATDGPEPQSEAFFFTDHVMPEDGSDDGNISASVEQTDAATSQQEPSAANGRPRAHSMQTQQRPNSEPSAMSASQRDAALARAIQSSPVRFNGSQESPIELDELTPRPTRRLLFPSPRREGEDKSLDVNAQSRKSTTPPGATVEKQAALQKTMLASDQQADIAIFEAFTTNDKENMPPPLDDDDELAHLFLGSPSALFKTPRKTPPSKTSQHFDNLLKTPTPASRRRKPLTPAAGNAQPSSHRSGNAAPMANDFLTSPSSSRYFLRSTPTRLAATPGRRSNAAGSNNSHPNSSQTVSPFSRHLSQMLQDATAEGTSFGDVMSPGKYDFSDISAMFASPDKGQQAVVDWEGLMRGDFGISGVFEDGSGAV